MTCIWMSLKLARKMVPNYKMTSLGSFIVCLTIGSRVVNSSISGSGIWFSSLTPCVVSLYKELYSTLSLLTQVYKWVPVTYCWGYPAMD